MVVSDLKDVIAKLFSVLGQTNQICCDIDAKRRKFVRKDWKDRLLTAFKRILRDYD